jgi:hypothetical protein
MHRTIELPQTEKTGEMPGQHLGSLLRQVSKTSMGEIDSLISELQALRRKPQTDGDRIQRDSTRSQGMAFRKNCFLLSTPRLRQVDLGIIR